MAPTVKVVMDLTIAQLQLAKFACERAAAQRRREVELTEDMQFGHPYEPAKLINDAIDLEKVAGKLAIFIDPTLEEK